MLAFVASVPIGRSSGSRQALDNLYASVYVCRMKTVARRFKIETLDQGKTWRVVERSSGNVVWAGKTFRNARTAHVVHELGYDWRTAARMGNA